MPISQCGLDLIKEFEGCRLAAYRCPAGKLTIGYGHVCLPNERVPPIITQDAAERLLLDDCGIVERSLKRWVKMPLEQHQLDALISLGFNIGVSALAGSTLMRWLSAGDFERAAEEFLRWKMATVNGKKVVLPGLVRRRQAERVLFLGEKP